MSYVRSYHGVYVIIESWTKKVVYVGVDQNINKFSRYKQHCKRRDEFGNWLWETEHKVEIFSEHLTKKEAHKVELNLIKVLEPRFNKIGKRGINND